MGFLKPVAAPLARVGTFGLAGLALSHKKKDKPVTPYTPPPTMLGEGGQRSLIDIRPTKSVY